MELKELKAQAYDLIAKAEIYSFEIEKIKKELTEVNQKISEVSKPAPIPIEE